MCLRSPALSIHGLVCYVARSVRTCPPTALRIPCALAFEAVHLLRLVYPPVAGDWAFGPARHLFVVASVSVPSAKIPFPIAVSYYVSVVFLRTLLHASAVDLFLQI